jgi:hypothetical protein
VIESDTAKERFVHNWGVPKATACQVLQTPDRRSGSVKQTQLWDLHITMMNISDISSVGRVDM